MFYGSYLLTLLVLTPPPIHHPETELHRYLYPIFHPNFGLEPPSQTGVHPSSLHRLSCTLCLATTNLLPRSLSLPSSMCRDTISAASYPVRSPPFFCPRCHYLPCQPLWVISSGLRPSSAISQTTPSPPSGLDRGPDTEDNIDIG